MKLPFSFSLQFVFRLLFPGFLITLALFPALRALCDTLYKDILSEYIVILSTIVVGWLFIVLDMQIYMLFEGRRYWPNWLRKLSQSAEVRRLSRLHEEYGKVRHTNRAKYIELSVELRRFPLNNEGEPTAVSPTRLGNLLASYEEYPLRVYGMDSIFYWYRIWVVISEDLREEIDNQQALVDSTLYMSAALYLSGLITIIYAGLVKWATFWWSDTLPKTETLLAMGIVAFTFAYLIYRASLHLHASFGEIYKSLFDIYRDKVNVDDIVNQIASLTDDPSINNKSSHDKYILSWRFLHNYKIKTDKGNVLVTKFYRNKN